MIVKQHQTLNYQRILYSYAALFLTMAWMLSSCDNSTSAEEEPKPKIVDGFILLDGTEEDDVAIEVGETVKFSGYALTETGDRIPIAELGTNWDWEWKSTDTAVFTVDASGNATGEGQGEAFCVLNLARPDNDSGSNALKGNVLSETAIERKISRLNALFTGRDSVFVTVFGVGGF